MAALAMRDPRQLPPPNRDSIAGVTQYGTHRRGESPDYEANRTDELDWFAGRGRDAALRKDD